MGGHLFRDVLNETANYAMTPAVDMFEREGKLVVKADLPGFTKEDIEVRIVENNLEIKGERKTEEEINRKNYMKVERTFGSFSRVLRLPENANGKKVDATFKDGVLELIMPLERVVDNSRKIEIK
jgi:HSP20 family protein